MLDPVALSQKAGTKIDVLSRLETHEDTHIWCFLY